MSANLYKNEKGTYYARIQVKGKDIRKSLRTAHRKVARERLKELQSQAKEIRLGQRSIEIKKWEDAVVRWIELQFSELKPKTQKRYQTSLRQLDPYFVGVSLGKISSVEINDYVLARKNENVSNATIKRDLTVMSRVMKVAKRAGWIKANPVPDEAEEIRERREPIKPVPLKDMAILIKRSPNGFKEMIRFLARTGCRQEEAASLEWSQLNFRENKTTCTFFKTKTSSPRVIELSERLVNSLKKLNRSGKYVFLSANGERYKNVPGRFRVLLRSAIKDEERYFRCHDLRHTYAIRSLQAGKSIYEVARQLGHSSVKTTEMYASWLTKAPK